MEMAAEIPPDQSAASSPVVDRKAHGRSKVTNGGALLPGIDGRSVWVRRCKDLIDIHLADLPDASAAEQSIVRCVAVLTTEFEKLEQKFALAGETILSTWIFTSARPAVYAGYLKPSG